MIVYRICNKNEIELIINEKNYDKVGKFFEINHCLNTHQYLNNKKYIHFFQNYDSIFYLDTIKDMFICVYDIPLELLNRYVGVGLYFDRFNFTNLEEVKEYAIETKLINFNFLVQVDRILEYIEYEDYLYKDISSHLETIYENDNKLLIKVNKSSF